ncbi:NPCBM/NEW2 domain-containing protein [Streptomyces sp. NPDC054783]
MIRTARAVGCETQPERLPGALDRLGFRPARPGDGRLLNYSDVQQGGRAASTLIASTNGVNELELRATDARDYMRYDHADWANAKVTCGGPTDYEAEAPGSTMAGAANLRRCPACSDGQAVGYIGNGPANYVTVNDVTANSDGNQKLTNKYLLSGTRSFFVSVNGGADQQVTLTGTDWNTVATASITVPLKAGSNTIKCHNDTAYAPDLDAISIG